MRAYWPESTVNQQFVRGSPARAVTASAKKATAQKGKKLVRFDFASD
jgi:hypothetical protein